MSDPNTPPTDPPATPPADPPAPPQNPPPAAPPAPPQPAQPRGGVDVGQQVLEALGAMPEKLVSSLKEAVPTLGQPPAPPAPPPKPQRRSFGEWWLGLERKS